MTVLEMIVNPVTPIKLKFGKGKVNDNDNDNDEFNKRRTDAIKKL